MTGTSTTEIRLLSGDKAKEVDPDGIEWPDTAVVIYAFEGDEVVGRIGVMDISHLEGMWLAEHKRSGTLGVRLMSAAEDLLRSIGRTHAMAFAHNSSPEVAGYLERLGYSELPVSTFTKEIQ
jgi:hypothetical protein